MFKNIETAKNYLEENYSSVEEFYIEIKSKKHVKAYGFDADFGAGTLLEEVHVIEESEVIVAFHIGRGGEFNNGGFKSFIGERNISEFTYDLFLSHENENDFKNRYGFSHTDGDQDCIVDLITDENYDELEESFGITREMLGEKVWSDGGGNLVGLTESESESGIGKIDIDGDYDTTICKRLTSCTDGELKMIIDSHDFIRFEIKNYASCKLGIEDESKKENN